MAKRYANVAFKAYATTTTFECELDDIKVGDFVLVPSWTDKITGRVMSFSEDKRFSLKKMGSVIRKATPEEINEVADVFGIPKNPDLASEDEDESFLTNSGYGTKELNKLLKKYNEKREAAVNENSAETKVPAKVIKESEEKQVTKPAAEEDDGLPGYWRYVAIAILALYFLKDYIFE